MDPAIVVASLSSAVALASLVMTYRASTRATTETSTNAREANVIRWAEELREDAADARSQAAGAREEATAAHRSMVGIRRNMEVLAIQLHDLILLIHTPGMNIERLRAMVPVQLNGGSKLPSPEDPR